MGSGKPEKKITKTKKRRREPLENGESAGEACSLDYDKSPIFKKNEGDVTEADTKAYKSKKAHKNKSKDSSSVVVNDTDDSFKVEKRNSKKSRKNNSKDSLSVVANDADDSCKGEKRKSKKSRKNKSKESSIGPGVVANDADDSLKGEKRKSKKAHKEDGYSTNRSSKLVNEVQEDEMPDVYQISIEEEDDSKGMKKWVKEYHEKRPGLKVLQERIDEFITAHEEQEEQLRKEREAKLSEEGWTVVVHRKGGKRTSDPESGVAVGAVAEAAVRDKMVKKKSKDFGLDFYRFQRKEAQRSEIMKLQSKFEEDKKRIQQVRAARKFRPY